MSYNNNKAHEQLKSPLLQLAQTIQPRLKELKVKLKIEKVENGNLDFDQYTSPASSSHPTDEWIRSKGHNKRTTERRGK